jgi:hypothetical protein
MGMGRSNMLPLAELVVSSLPVYSLREVLLPFGL